MIFKYCTVKRINGSNESVVLCIYFVYLSCVIVYKMLFTRWLFTGLTNGRCKRFYEGNYLRQPVMMVCPLRSRWWSQLAILRRKDIMDFFIYQNSLFGQSIPRNMMFYYDVLYRTWLNDELWFANRLSKVLFYNQVLVIVVSYCVIDGCFHILHIKL